MTSCATILGVTSKPTLWVFRIAVSLTAVLTFAQALFAGSFLAGHFDMLAIHKNNSTYVVVAAALTIVAAVLLWRPGRGPAWPVWVSLAFFGCLALQTFLGYRRLLSLHVPLGTAIIAALLPLLVWAWRPARKPAAVLR
jgi:hypothetical protein